MCLHLWKFWSDEKAWKFRVHFERPQESDYWVEFLIRPSFSKFLTSPSGAANQRVQATPGSALGEFVAAWAGAPDPGRSVQMASLRLCVFAFSPGQQH